VVMVVGSFGCAATGSYSSRALNAGQNCLSGQKTRRQGGTGYKRGKGEEAVETRQFALKTAYARLSINHQ